MDYIFYYRFLAQCSLFIHNNSWKVSHSHVDTASLYGNVIIIWHLHKMMLHQRVSIGRSAEIRSKFN